MRSAIGRCFLTAKGVDVGCVGDVGGAQQDLGRGKRPRTQLRQAGRRGQAHEELSQGRKCAAPPIASLQIPTTLPTDWLPPNWPTCGTLLRNVLTLWRLNPTSACSTWRERACCELVARGCTACRQRWPPPVQA